MRKLAILFLFFCTTAFAAKKSQLPPGGEMFDYPIRAQAMISVQSYDPQTRTYRINLEKEPAVGPNFTTLEYLNTAIDLPDFEKVKKNPDKIVGNIYQLQKKLILISRKAVEKRKK